MQINLYMCLLRCSVCLGSLLQGAEELFVIHQYICNVGVQIIFLSLATVPVLWPGTHFPKASRLKPHYTTGTDRDSWEVPWWPHLRSQGMGAASPPPPRLGKACCKILGKIRAIFSSNKGFPEAATAQPPPKPPKNSVPYIHPCLLRLHTLFSSQVAWWVHGVIIPTSSNPWWNGKWFPSLARNSFIPEK